MAQAEGDRPYEDANVIPALKEMLAAKTPYLLDIIISRTEHVLPMIPSGKTVKDIILE